MLKEKVFIFLKYPKYTDIQKASVAYCVLSIIKSDKSDFQHYCCTDHGSSGSPILLLSSSKVIGIHKQAEKKTNFQFNIGTFLKFPIEEFLENKNVIKIRNTKKELTEKEIYEIKYKKFITDFKNNKFSKILFMIGWGVNFSEESILFQNNSKYYEELDKTNIFNLEHFIKEPKEVYNFMKSLNMDELKPNIYYKFMNFFVKKKLAKYIFTQNVDGLEIKAKIPEE